MAVNTESHFWTAKAFLPAMIKKNHGHIVTVASAAGTVSYKNKAGYTATLVACGWAGAVLKKVTRESGKEPHAQKDQNHRKSRKGTNDVRPTDGPT